MSDEKIIEKAVEIRSSDYQPMIGFLSPELILCTLPHSDPGPDVPIWVRRNRNLTLTLQPRFDLKTMKPLYPFGSIPRLSLIWMITQAVQKRQRRIMLDASFNGLMREVGLDPNTGGGKRSDRYRFLQQVERLSRSIIRFDDDRPDRHAYKDIEIAPEGMIWFDRKEEDKRSYLEFSDKFFELVLERPVPLDLKIAIGLKRSPLSMDLYAWLSYTSHIYGKRCSMAITWDDLSKQIGGQYGLLRQFRYQVRKALPDIQVLYPGLKIDASSEEHLTVLAGSRSSVDFGRYKKRERENGVDGDRVVEIHNQPVD